MADFLFSLGFSCIIESRTKLFNSFQIDMLDVKRIEKAVLLMLLMIAMLAIFICPASKPLCGEKQAPVELKDGVEYCLDHVLMVTDEYYYHHEYTAKSFYYSEKITNIKTIDLKTQKILIVYIDNDSEEFLWEFIRKNIYVQGIEAVEPDYIMYIDDDV